MDTLSDKSIQSPTPLQSDEIIQELIGREVGERIKRYSVAHVTIPPKGSSLAHYHPEAMESYLILKGRAWMELGNETRNLERGQAILIEPPKPHKIGNDGTKDLEFLAICWPAWEPSNTRWLKGGPKSQGKAQE